VESPSTKTAAVWAVTMAGKYSIMKVMGKNGSTNSQRAIHVDFAPDWTKQK